MILNGTGDNLQAFMSGAAATTNPSFFVTYADINTTTSALTPDSAGGALNGTTDVNLVSGVAGAKRMIKNLSICNIDTAPVNVTVQFEDGTDRVIVDAFSIPTGKTLYWSLETGWVLQPADDQTISAGSWTPTVDFATTGDWSPVYVVQEGRFSTIGDLVFIECRLSFNSNAWTTASGTFTIEGLPFTAVNDVGIDFFALGAIFFANIDLDANVKDLQGLVLANDTSIEMFQTLDALGVQGLDEANIPASTNSFALRLTGWYRKA